MNNKASNFVFMVPLLLFFSGCSAVANIPETYKKVSEQRQSALANKYGDGVYYRYRGRIENIHSANEDIGVSILQKVAEKSRTDNNSKDLCRVIEKSLHYYENGYYSVDVKCHEN